MTKNTNNTNTETNVKADRINSALDSVISTFQNGTAPAMIAMSLFDSSDKPCAKWSFLNQLIVGAHNTTDARTFKQWLSVERAVQKGSNAFYIFAPIIKKEKEEKADETVETSKLRGYKMMPVFRVENTEGEPLPGPKVESLNLPLIEKAHEWNINVRAEGFNDLTRLLQGSQAYGVFRRYVNGTAPDEIVLATPEASVFFHELSHAAQARIKDLRITREQNELYEVVAEFSAAVICEMSGMSSKTLGNSYAYVKHYAEKAKLDLHKALNLVLSDVKAVLNLILETGSETTEEQSVVPSIEAEVVEVPQQSSFRSFFTPISEVDNEIDFQIAVCGA